METDCNHEEELDVMVKMPRYTYFFRDEITSESVQELIDILYNFQEVDLFFSTPGGELCAMTALIHYLNSRHEDIHILMTESIASAGTLLLIDFKGQVTLTEDLDYILFHTGDRLLNTTRKEDVDNKTLISQLRQFNLKFSYKLSKLGLNEKQIKQFHSGKNVVLYRKDFNKLNLKNNGN
jgi:hypothetical protein